MAKSKIPLTDEERKARKREYLKNWRLLNPRDPEEAKAAAYAWRDENPEKYATIIKKSRLKRYGTTIAEYDAQVELQHGLCALCQTNDPGRSNKNWCVNRKYANGTEFRLLCYHCNTALGYFRHSTAILQAAIDYLINVKPVPILNHAEHLEKYRNQETKGYTNKRIERLRYVFNLSVAEHIAMLEGQNHRCAICKTDEPGHFKSWCIDHDHSTNSIRGLLCRACNLGLGHLNHDPVLLRFAIDYIDPRLRSDSD